MERKRKVRGRKVKCDGVLCPACLGMNAGGVSYHTTSSCKPVAEIRSACPEQQMTTNALCGIATMISPWYGKGWKLEGCALEAVAIGSLPDTEPAGPEAGEQHLKKQEVIMNHLCVQPRGSFVRLVLASRLSWGY